MKVSHTCFRPNVPQRNLYLKGRDFINHEIELGFDETLHLLKALKNHRSSLLVEATATVLEFYIEGDDSLWVEMYGTEYYWGAEQINLVVGEELLGAAYAGEDLRDYVSRAR